MAKVLMVAEKPSIAKSISESLSNRVTTRKSYSKVCPVHEFQGSFFGESAAFLVTSVCGHLYSRDFPKHLNNWERVDPVQLFDEKSVKVEVPSKGGNLVKHLQIEAAKCNYLVLWLDCDREGENICFEVIETVQEYMKPANYQQVYRARFSSLTAQDIRFAMNERNLVSPDLNQSLSVDARQELDLKIGVAFTRFQTLFFQGKYGNLDSALISYGPCQTPTLGFCVKRHDEIQGFRPENYYVIHAITQTNPVARPKLVKGRIKHQPTAQTMVKKLSEFKTANVVRVSRSSKQVSKPQGLNTVNMLKLASTYLGMSPHQAMGAAERLYLSGYITYPRTESTAYAPSFDLMAVVSKFTEHPEVGEHARGLLGGRFKKPLKGLDAGDHPPITPCASAPSNSGDYRLYIMILRYFLATVSRNAEFAAMTVTFRIGSEEFSLEGTQTTDPGFSDMTPWACASSKPIPNFEEGQEVPLKTIELDVKQTSPPSYLTESELLGLMEHHGIGTDASMPVHINNICERNYVRVDPQGRRLVPTQLGVTLVHGYFAVDKELVLPIVRADIEKRVSQIAKGEAEYAGVVMHALDIFKRKFIYFRENIGNIDQLFEASFSPIAQSSGKALSKCGRCYRFMVFLSLKPARLYCNNCEMTYKVPQNGVIQLYKERRCPVDNFEVLLYKTDKVSYLFCPACYTDPPFPNVLPLMSCVKCPKVDCINNLSKNVVSSCHVCGSDMILSELTKPKWKLFCVNCNVSMGFCEGAADIQVLPDLCMDCGESYCVSVKFKEKSTFGENEHIGCPWCDPQLSALCESKNQRDNRPQTARRGNRGRGGRGGRGRRSRGGGRHRHR